MSKYVYENHEVEEGLFVTLQLIDAIDMKYSCCFPADIEKDIEKLSRLPAQTIPASVLQEDNACPADP